MGLGLAATAWAIFTVAKGYGRAVKWWHWVMLLVAALLWIFSFSWLGAQLGEQLGGTTYTGAAFFGWGVTFVISLILISLTFQLIRRNKKTNA